MGEEQGMELSTGPLQTLKQGWGLVLPYFEKPLFPSLAFEGVVEFGFIFLFVT